MKQRVGMLIKVIFIMSLFTTFSCSDDKSTKPTNNIEVVPALVLVEGGTFNNGTADVTISNFFIGKYELTQAEYQAVMGPEPAYDHGAGDDYPVYNVNWIDAVVYCNTRSIQEGLTPCYNTISWDCDFSANGYRLPTEMEWMFAAKGGNKEPATEYNQYVGTNEESELTRYAWYRTNSASTSHIVGTKLPNQLGLYDMSGNVKEWCYDLRGNYSNTPQTDPIGPNSGYNRVTRGGSWASNAVSCRVVIRNSDFLTNSYNYLGFRVARRAE